MRSNNLQDFLLCQDWVWVVKLEKIVLFCGEDMKNRTNQMADTPLHLLSFWPGRADISPLYLPTVRLIERFLLSHL